jgi:hypothetical protein
MSFERGWLLFFGGIMLCIAGGVGIAAALGSHVNNPLAVYIMGAVGGVFYILAGLGWLGAWTVNGTIKIGRHDASDPMCGCGRCEAYGRWLKRPLPEAHEHDVAAWLDEITDHCAPTELVLIRDYINTDMSTAAFLRDWEAKQRPSAPMTPDDPCFHNLRESEHPLARQAPISAGNPLEGYAVCRLKFNGHNSQCGCRDCAQVHAERHDVWSRGCWWNKPWSKAKQRPHDSTPDSRAAAITRLMEDLYR